VRSSLEVRQTHSSKEASEQNVDEIDVAEQVERRGLTKRKSFNRSKTMTQSMEGLLPRLERLGEAAKRNKHGRIATSFGATRGSSKAQ